MASTTGNTTLGQYTLSPGSVTSVGTTAQAISGAGYSIPSYMTSTQPYTAATQPYTWISTPIDYGLSFAYPFVGNIPLTEQDAALIRDFKTRHPDFDDYYNEIELVIKKRPGLKNTPLFIALIYDMAKDIRKLIEGYTEVDKIEGIIDGPTKEVNRSQ